MIEHLRLDQLTEELADFEGRVLREVEIFSKKLARFEAAIARRTEPERQDSAPALPRAARDHAHLIERMERANAQMADLPPRAKLSKSRA
jgi:hypothetical protein